MGKKKTNEKSSISCALDRQLFKSRFLSGICGSNFSVCFFFVCAGISTLALFNFVPFTNLTSFSVEIYQVIGRVFKFFKFERFD